MIDLITYRDFAILYNFDIVQMVSGIISYHLRMYYEKKPYFQFFTLSHDYFKIYT
jgi:hypothetical protein